MATLLSTRRLLVFLAGVAFVALAAGAWYYWPRPAPRTPFEPPKVALDNADPAVREVVEQARAGVRDRPESPAAWGYLGQVLRAHGYDPQADVCFRKAEELDPDEPRWPYLLGTHWRLSDPDKALPRLERAVALCARHDPARTAPRLLLAEVLAQGGRWQEAEKHFRKVLEVEPNNFRGHYGLGLCAEAQKDYKAALDHFSRAANSPAVRKKALARLAAVYLRSGDEKAADEFNHLADQAPPDQLWFDPYIAEYLALEAGHQGEMKKVESLEANGRLAEASGVLSRLAQDYPDDRSLVSLGISLAKAGQFERAEQALRKSIKLEPEKVQGHYYLSLVLYSRAERLWNESGGQSEQARNLFRQAAESSLRAIQLKPDHAFAHAYHGLALKHLGKQAEALASLRQAVTCRPELPDLHLYLGEALAEAGHKQEAIAELVLAVELAPKNDPRPRAALERVRNSGKSKE
jgi:tetratricopeptide (TPR) repeat protein